MNNVERVAFAVLLFAGGAALGMAYEHQRFLKEIQGLTKKHADTEPSPTVDTPPPKTPEVAA